LAIARNWYLNSFGTTIGLRYEWDWEDDGVFDNITTNPQIYHMWPDDHTGKITLRVNDTVASTNGSASYPIIIHNADPVVDQTLGNITPQPAWEASTVTFSGYTVDDPAGEYDTYTYFWDFDGDLVYDVSGACVKNKVPTESWYYNDDFHDEVSLLIVDEDGGTTNLSVPYSLELTPSTSSPYGTGYIYNSTSTYYRSFS